MTKTQVPLDPALALLSLGIDNFPASLRSTITHLLLAARLSIKRKWKDSRPPSVIEVIDLTNPHNTYERMLASSWVLCTPTLSAGLLGTSGMTILNN